MTLLVPAIVLCRERRRGGVRVREAVVDESSSRQVDSQLGNDRRLLQQLLQVLTELAVVQADHQPQPRVEPTSHERGPYVRVVVLVDERQRCGPLHPRRDQRLLVRLRRLYDTQVPAARALCPGPLCRPAAGHTPEQSKASYGPPADSPVRGVGARRYYERHPLPVHLAQLGGQPTRQAVLATNNYAAGGKRKLSLQGIRHGPGCLVPRHPCAPPFRL